MLAERFIFGTSEYRMAERLFIYRQSDPVIPSYCGTSVSYDGSLFFSLSCITVLLILSA